MIEDKILTDDEFGDLVSAQAEAAINGQCDLILAKADKHNVQLEVVWAAFSYKEQFPKATLLECLQVGLAEYVL